MEYHNFQGKRELAGVDYQPSRRPSTQKKIDETKEPFEITTNLAESADNYLFKHRADMQDADIPYGHIKTRQDVHLDDETELKDTYTTVNTLLVMAGVSALIFGGMVWSNA
jgi:hypothetical protein